MMTETCKRSEFLTVMAKCSLRQLMGAKEKEGERRKAKIVCTEKGSLSFSDEYRREIQKKYEWQGIFSLFHTIKNVGKNAY